MHRHEEDGLDELGRAAVGLALLILTILGMAGWVIAWALWLI